MNRTDTEKLLLILSHCVLAAVVAVCACVGVTRSSAALDRSLKEVTVLAEEHAQAEQPGEEAAEDSDEDEPVKSKAKGLKDGEYTGTGQGYGGPITLKLTVKNGTIKSLEVVSAGGETPAYFSMAKSIIPNIISSGSANVDSVSGATYSSNGIKTAAAEALKKAGGDGSVNLKKAAPKVKGKSGKGTKKNSYSKPSGGWKDGTYTGSAKGFGGTVSVTVTIKNGKIVSISTSGKNETASYWSRAQAVKGKILKAQSPKVDAVSGATYSSTGIINATINALKKAGGKDTGKSKKAKDKHKDKKDKKKKDRTKYSKPKNGWEDGTYIGSAKGYGGTVSVKVTIKNGKIASIKATGKKETAEYWKRAQAVKGRILKAQDPKVDAVSGATYSSNGIINAVIDALSKAGKKGPKDQAITTAKEEYSVTVGETVSIGAKAKTTLKYSSSKPAVARVDGKGKVTALKGGKTVITITAVKTSKYKKAEKKVTVTVVKKGQKITIDGYTAGSTIEEEEGNAGNTLSLAGSCDSGQPLSYSSSAPDVASVDESGTVTIKGTGNAVITISAPETDVYKKASVNIFIKIKKPDDPVDPPVLINGTFTGEGEGYGGIVTAVVEISDSKIISINVEGSKETSKYWTKAKKIVSKMVAGQTWDIDAVSGATLSSNGIRDAVKQALEKAGLIS